MTIHTARKIFGAGTTVKLMGHRLDPEFYQKLSLEEWEDIGRNAFPGSKIQERAIEQIIQLKQEKARSALRAVA